MRVSGMRNLYFVSKPRTSRGMRFFTNVGPNLYPQPLDTDPPRRISLGEKVHPLGNRPGPARTQRKVVLASGNACDFSHALSDAFALSCRSADSTEYGKAGHLQHHSGSCSPGRPRRPYYVAALLCVSPPRHQRSSSHAALHFARRPPFATCSLALSRILTLLAR